VYGAKKPGRRGGEEGGGGGNSGKDNKDKLASSNVHLFLCNVPPPLVSSNPDPNDLRTRLDKISGFPHKWSGCTATDKDICETDYLWDDNKDHKVVYLTSDSPNIITTLSNDVTYIIGGIVDRNRLKNKTMEKAERLGIEHGKLPLTRSGSGSGSETLTTNHVFEILGRWVANGGDWGKAVEDTVPDRGKGKREKARQTMKLPKN